VRISCRLSEVVPVAEPERGAVDGPDHGEGPGAEPTVAVEELDLRGMTAQEIDIPVVDALERAYHSGPPTIRFIHGKGSGVLRERVADLLGRHPYVDAYRLGHWDEGGSGVTIAKL